MKLIAIRKNKGTSPQRERDRERESFINCLKPTGLKEISKDKKINETAKFAEHLEALSALCTM